MHNCILPETTMEIFELIACDDTSDNWLVLNGALLTQSTVSAKFCNLHDTLLYD